MQSGLALAAAFLAARPAAAPTLDPDALARVLAAMVAAGRAAWPDAALADAAFVAHVAARAPAATLAELERLHAADLFLACACSAGDAGCIAAFERALLAPLPALVERARVAPDVAGEAVQALRANLFVGKKLVDSYDGRGAIAAWIRVAAVRAASNARRDTARREQLVRAEGLASPVAPAPALDPALALVKRRYGDTFTQALRDAFASLDEVGRNVLRLHFTDGLNLDAIARVLGMSRATAGRRVLAAREHVREETLRLLGERIAATPDELDSLLAVVRSTLDVGLSALL